MHQMIQSTEQFLACNYLTWQQRNENCNNHLKSSLADLQGESLIMNKVTSSVVEEAYKV